MKTLYTSAALLLFSLALSAANAPVQQGVTSKQIAWSYFRNDATVCIWEVSTSNTYSPLVADTVGALGQDTGVAGQRWFTVGAGTALDATAVYYWRQTCDAEVYTGQFTTLAAITPVASTTSISTGGAPRANKMRLEYGPTPSLGSAIEGACTPRCSITGIPVTKDSLLFAQHSYLNETDVVNQGRVYLVVVR